MIHILLVEDEPASARQLERYLTEMGADIRIIGRTDSVSSTVNWFKEEFIHPDLIFMDIRLADGDSFEIFSLQTILCPVIFVTAYDEYALQAFGANGIDYLLKPIDPTELRSAFEKFVRFRSAHSHDSIKQEQLIDLLKKVQDQQQHYRESFLVHYREKLIPLHVQEIAWFFTEYEIVYVRTWDERQFVLTFTLEQLEKQLNMQHFFRVNRQFLVSRKAIREAALYFNGRLSLTLNPAAGEKVLISKARVPEFKNWMDH